MYTVTQCRSARNSVIRFLLSVVIASLSLFGSLVVAQTSTLSYQGTLSFNGTTVSDGQYEMTVTLYADQSGTQPVWSDIYNADVRAGVFSVLLGAGKPLPASKSLDRTLWVGVRIGQGKEMRPLTQLGGVPYALNVADKAITAEKIDADYISSFSVNGRKISGNGKSLDLASGPGMLMIYDELKNRLLLSSTGGVEGKQDPQHVSSGFGVNTANPCTTNTDGGNGFNSLLGGCNNSSGVGTTIGYASLVGGLFNNANGDYAVTTGGHENNSNFFASSLVGGEFNTSGTEFAFLGGGQRNKAGGGGAPVVSGGADNQITVTGGLNPAINRNTANPGAFTANTSQYAGIASGYQNLIVNSDFSGIDAGQMNTIGGPSTLLGNTYNADHSWIGGGKNNEIQGSYSAIPGGHDLIIGSSTLAFNADPTAQITDLATNNFNQLVFFNDAPLWMGNTSGTPAGIRFYSSNQNLTYSGGPIYTEIVASNNQQTSITLTLPSGSDLPFSSTLGGSGSWLMSDQNGNLSWEETVPPTMISTAGGAPNDVLTLVGPLLIPTWAPIGSQPIPFSSITSATNNATLVVGGSLSYAGGTIDANIFSLNTTGTNAVDLFLTGGTGQEVAGILQTTNGGTGWNSVTQDGLLFGNAAATLGIVAPPTTGSGFILTYTPNTGGPAWTSIAPSGSVFFSNVNPGTTTSTSTNTNNLFIGTNGSLRPSGSGSTRGVIEATEFSHNPNGTTAVDLNPSTGNPEVSGQMLVPNGGTGLSSVAANELLVGSITSTTTLSVVPIASANGHILYFNSGGLQWQAPPAINSVLFPNVQGSTTPNTNQSMLVGSGSSLTIATGSTGQIEATRFGRNRTHSNRTDRVDLNLPTPQGQQTPEEPEINGVLQVANGGLGLSQPGTAGQLLGVTGVGATAAPTWLDGTSTGGGTGAGPAQPHNLTSTSKTIQTASLVNVSFVIVSSNTNKLDMILGDGVDGQLLVVMYEQSGNTQHSVLFKTNGSQNVIMRKQLLLRDKDAAMFIFRAKTGTDPGDWIYIGENN